MKALKDLRKTHGRTAPEKLPPRLAKMLAVAQKEAETKAAVSLMQLQLHQYWQQQDYNHQQQLEKLSQGTPNVMIETHGLSETQRFETNSYAADSSSVAVDSLMKGAAAYYQPTNQNFDPNDTFENVEFSANVSTRKANTMDCFPPSNEQQLVPEEHHFFTHAPQFCSVKDDTFEPIPLEEANIAPNYWNNESTGAESVLFHWIGNEENNDGFEAKEQQQETEQPLIFELWFIIMCGLYPHTEGKIVDKPEAKKDF